MDLVDDAQRAVGVRVDPAAPRHEQAGVVRQQPAQRSLARLVPGVHGVVLRLQGQRQAEHAVRGDLQLRPRAVQHRHAHVELTEEGGEVRQDESFGTIESVKAAADLFAPVSGVVGVLHEPFTELTGSERGSRR